MPRTAFRLRPAFKAITDGTRALHYTLLNRTDSDDALNPTEGCEDLYTPKREDSPPLTISSDDNDEPPTEDTFAFDMGSFAEIENRKSCPFCSFVKTLCRVTLPWEWIVRLKNNSKSLKIHPRRRSWWHFGLCRLESHDIDPCACISHPDCSDEATTYLQNYLGSWVIYKLDVASSSRLFPRIRKMSEVVEGKLDFDIVKTWMKSCSDNYVLCSQAQKSISLSGIRPYLIDVERMVVVKSKPEYVYAALSYVWGNEEDSRPVYRPEDSVFVVFEGISPRLRSRGYRNPLEGACKTVTDAIDLVKGIGIRYLWVGSYCISSDPVKRALHIKQMDKIYEGAWVTIVALSGTHANYGIPGLSVPLEVTPQPCVDLESGRFVASRLLEPLEDAASSPWNRRAWTMQEAALSKRCLCFTDKSVFWICTEGLQLDFVHAGLSRPDNHFLKFPFSVSGIENELRIENFREIMNQYSQRQLTNASDALDAITGILSHITQKTSMEFCFGQPQKEFVRGLLWKSDSRRRVEFPSWSWLGWYGEITLPMWLEYRDELSEAGLFGLELDEGEEETYFVKEMDIAKVLAYPQVDNQSPILKISSQVARFRIYNLLNKGTNFIPAERYISRDDDGDAEIEEAHSDLWCLDIHHDSNAPCPHNSFGFSCTDPEVSGSIQQSGVEHEFVLLAHWREYGKNEQTEWIPISRDFFNGDEGIGDLVLALLIVRDGNQNAERISLVPIPHTDWEKASPQEMVVNFV